MNKVLKRTIAGGLSIVMAASILFTQSLTNVTEVQAKTKVFDKISERYKPSGVFTILEIVPEAEDYTFTVPPNGGEHEDGRNQNDKISVKKNAEMGYFIAKQPKDNPYSGNQRDTESATGVSRAGRYGSPTLTASTSAEYQNALYDMYTYGLIKPNGTDQAGIYDHLGEYPIFAHYTIFSLYPTKTAKNTFDKLLEKGVYSDNANGTGKYILADGYKLNENGTICKVSVSKNEIPQDPSVSNNTVSGNTPEPKYEEVEVLTPVTDIDMTKMQLPQSKDGSVIYVTVAPSTVVQENGTNVTKYSGNLDFTRAEEATTKTLYYGFSDRTLYYSTDSDAKMKYTNSDWFREYVLGDNKKFSTSKIEYKTVSASKVKKEEIASADLVYVSGTNELFTPKTNDISDEVLIELFNRVVVDHKAVMMDYKLYNEDLKTNISKLALLLWQNEQSASFTKATVKVNEDGKEEKLTQSWFDVDSKKLVSTKGLFADKDMVSFLKNGLNELANGNAANPTATNGNFVRGNLYVYNHHRDDFVKDAYGQSVAKSQVDAEDNFANGDFATAYSAEITMAGFSEVVNYITTMNTNSLTGAMNTAVTPAVAIQYILVADGQPLTLMKNTLRILEIQPSPSYLFNYKRGSMDYSDLDDIVQLHDDSRKYDSANAGQDFTNDGKLIRDQIKKNRKDFVKNYLSSYYSDDIDDKENTMLKFISFTSMTVTEFNGRNEDLVESYDIIYIGANNHRNMWFEKKNNQFRYTKPFIKTSDGTAYGVTQFKDKKNMEGNVYYNMGDTTEVYAGRYGTQYAAGKSFTSGYIDGEKFGQGNYSENDKNEDRFTGRDITKNKLNKLKEFLVAQGLVIVDGDIYGYKSGATEFDSTKLEINPTKTATGNADGDHGRVDNSSNMYEFIQFGRGYRYNYSFDDVKDENGKVTLKARSYVPNINATGNQVSFENLVSASYLLKNPDVKDDYNKYVSSDRLNLILTDMPTPYTYEYEATGNVINPSTIKYMEYTEDGVRCLKYEFSIGKELNSVINPTDTYIATLYFDLNNDGKYSKTTEKIDDVTITLNSTSGVQPVKNADGEYILNLNTPYVLKRKLSEEYAGIIKWKLEVKSTVDTYNHATQEGYTLVKNITGQDKVVKILQIAPDSGANLNLENLSKSTTNNWSSFLKNAPGYDVKIKTVNMTAFENDFDTKYQAYSNDSTKPALTLADYATKVYFENYELIKNQPGENDVTGVNMLVIGFGDDIQAFKSLNAIDAITAFIAKGKPVLMTHDVLGWNYAAPQNVRLRQLVGMDKYAVTQNIKQSATTTGNQYSYVNKLYSTIDNASVFGELHANTIFNSANATDQNAITRMESFITSMNKEVAYLPGSERGTIEKQKSGYSNFFMDWENVEDQYWSEAPGTKIGGIGSQAPFRGYNIQKLNGGQITEFPYRLPDSFQTNTTHSQYFELDLSADADKDGESDVVVWYTLGTPTGNYGGNGSSAYDDCYGASLDPANGYYIYNDGNVTYTGAGHSSLDDAPVTEKQLFVNTLLAAFEVGNQAPVAGFYESTKVNEKPTSCLVVPYDENVTTDKDASDPNKRVPVNTYDSSVLKDGTDYMYKFVDPNAFPGNNAQKEAIKALGTKMYFKVSDSNLVRGTKSIYAKYYVKVEENMHPTGTGTQKTVRLYNTTLPVVTINNVEVVDISRFIDIYDVNQENGEFNAAPRARITDVNISYPDKDLTPSKDNREHWLYGTKGLQSGTYYGIYLPMAFLNENASFTLYLETMTSTTSISTAGEEVAAPDTQSNFDTLCVTKADLLYLN